MELNKILKGVSRSFYLSLRFLPKTMRHPMGLAFLCCKTADTIADTRLLPLNLRLDILRQYRNLFETSSTERPSAGAPERHSELFDLLRQNVATSAENPAERDLLLHQAPILEAVGHLPQRDSHLIRQLVRELTQGMIIDLTRFPGDTVKDLVALESEEELDQYTYYVAGCVGLFWTKMVRAHYGFAKKWSKELEDCGIRFGKGLQLVNILRDLPRDLAQGRCYLPQEGLQPYGVEASQLTDPSQLQRVRPFLLHLLQRSRGLLAEGAVYARAFPPYALRLKWVVILPMQLGFQTLTLLEQSEKWLDPQTVIKVPRSAVYRSMFSSLPQALAPRLIRYDRYRSAVAASPQTESPSKSHLAV